jgi:hypothetical protein
MSTFKESIKPFGIKYKFWYIIKNWSEDEILEFLRDDIFGSKDFTLSFEEAKEKYNNSLGVWQSMYTIDYIMTLEDQQELYKILQNY